MDKFLSCDWGTSSFRLRLIRSEDLTVIAEVKNDVGIAETFRSWQEKGNPSDRRDYYTAIINDQIDVLGREADIPLQGVPVILSGMASSTIGLMELPYKELPFDINGMDLEVKVLNDGGAANPIIIISGARTEDDVMRGEETKMVGCASSLAVDEPEQLVILPGTHPKHITIKNQKVSGFKTFMTGEFFDLLSTESILSGSVEKDGNFNDPANRESFIKAVKTSQATELLHQSFMVRTNQVLKNIPKQQNFYYLSGLLIGAELKELKPGIPVYLLGGITHMPLYTLACEVLGIPVIRSLDADNALIKGQQIIYQRV